MKYVFNAYHLNTKLNLKELLKILPFKPFKVGSDEISFEIRKDCFIFIFRIGAVVFFNVNESDQRREVERIAGSLELEETGLDDVVNITDEFYLVLQPKSEISLTFDTIKCPELSYDVLFIMALALAQSVALESFENVVEDMLKSSKKITKNLEKKGKIKQSTKQLIKHIGYVLTLKQAVVSKLYVLDKPESVWDDSSMYKLYSQISVSLELAERYKLLDYKFKLIQDSLEILTDLIKTKKETLLEILIIVLIFVEVVLFVYELFFT